MERVGISICEGVVDERAQRRNEERIDATYRDFLKNAAAELNLAPQQAERVLVAVIRVLDRRLPFAEMSDLASQLPVRLRELLASEAGPRDGLRPRDIGRDEFLALVAEQLEVDAARAESYVRRVFQVLADRVSSGEIEQVIHLLPRGLRALWPSLDPAQRT
jgi:uncharacterized protein (DUF2267 family)